MIKNLLLLLIVCTTCFACKQQKVEISQLKQNPEKYINNKIITTGKVVHVCGVDKKKLKLKSKTNQFIKVITTKDKTFDYKLNGKNIEIIGTVSEDKITKEQIDKMEEKMSIPCHVDHKPCHDVEWIKRKQKAGTATKIAKKCIDKLRKMLQESKKGYISVIIIKATSWKEI